MLPSPDPPREPPPPSPPAGPPSEPPPQEDAPEAAALSPEEQMERFAAELKEQDWGHQPC